VQVRRAEVSWLPAAAAGGLLGLVIGWLFVGWASRRTEHNVQAHSGFGDHAAYAA
jgi:hypothetical protein